MHPALLIDEILRQIFHFCSETDPPSLVSAALSCTTWKDPALDLIWNRLPSFGPLILLLPQTQGDNIYNEFNQKELEIFHSYAQRVKHISQRRTITIPSYLNASIATLSHSSPVLPCLRTAHISIPRNNPLILPFNLSPSLTHLEVDLGFKASTTIVDSTLCDYLSKATALCPELKHVSLRGLASKGLNYVLSNMHNLHFLTLRLGRSLLRETLAAITSFPHLKELEVHAGHLHADDLDDIPIDNDFSIFPSLEKLHIRAKSSFIEALLNHWERTTLHRIHIDLDDDSPSTTSWNTIFSSIGTKSFNTLEHLSLEHHFELPEVDSSISPDGTPSPSAYPMSFLDLEALEPLHDLRHLRYFSCDMTIPPIFGDKDLARIVCWWPELEHLELGCAPQADESERAVTPDLTIASLSCISVKCPKLKKLILPLTIVDIPESPSSRPIASELRTLTIAQLKTSTPSALAGYLRSLFPLLWDLEGPCDDNQIWSDTRLALQCT